MLLRIPTWMLSPPPGFTAACQHVQFSLGHSRVLAWRLTVSTS
jgi:hypothetical protein